MPKTNRNNPYEFALEWIQKGRKKTERQFSKNVRLYLRSDKAIEVRLYFTNVIVLFPDGITYQLDSGRWHSWITRCWINRLLPREWGVASSRGNWEVYFYNESYKILEGLGVLERALIPKPKMRYLQKSCDVWGFRNGMIVNTKTQRVTYPKRG
jgi:hypothetical protein